MTSSMPAPIACPVKPFVLVIRTDGVSAPNAFLSPWISASADPPRAGVKVSWLTNTVSLASCVRDKPVELDKSSTNALISETMWSMSSLVPWYAELLTLEAFNVARTSAPRCAASSARSSTIPIAPIPRSIPFRDLSKGLAAS